MLVLMCEAAGHRFALPARQVVEVVPRVRLQTVPHAPAWLAGVCVYRGRVTPVMDLTYLTAAKLCPSRWANRILLVTITDEATSPLCGLIVEKVKVAQVAVGGDTAAALPVGVAPWGPVLLDAEGMYQLLELPRLFSAERRAALLPPTSEPG
jgi:chemotaxis-related protein WspB